MKRLISRLLRCWRNWLPFVPLAILMVAGYVGYRKPPPPEDILGRITLYINLIAAFDVAVLVCNPFGLLTRVLAPITRVLSVAVTGMIVLGVEGVWLDGYLRAMLLASAAILCLIVHYKAKGWLQDSLIRQSAHVDRVLGQLSSKVPDMASTAWDNHGAAEARALLHQSTGTVCDEATLHSIGRSCYQLAYLDGAGDKERDARRYTRELKQLKDRINDLEGQLYDYRRRDEDARNFGEERQKLLEQIDRLKAEVHDLNIKLEEAHANMDELHPIDGKADIPAPPDVSSREARDEMILRYYEKVGSLQETGEAFGLSKSGAKAAVDRAKKRRETA